MLKLKSRLNRVKGAMNQAAAKREAVDQALLELGQFQIYRDTIRTSRGKTALAVVGVCQDHMMRHREAAYAILVANDLPPERKALEDLRDNLGKIGVLHHGIRAFFVAPKPQPK